jgi:MFS family permease
MAGDAARWQALALLFTLRTAMAFQFQAVGSLSPLFAGTFGIGLADIGLLIGLYLAPGIAIALPGGALAARFGDRTMVLGGLALMVAGGTLCAVGTTFGAQGAGRLIAGTGGVVLNVLMTKMVADWFAGREIATAMAIFVNSWPLGIALALAVLPAAAGTGGFAVALGITAGFAALCLPLFAGFYRPAPRAAAAATVAGWPKGSALVALLAAAGIWALYNAAFAMMFGFGPALMTERGLSLVTASGMISLVMWLVALSVPLGGVLADQLQRRDLVLLVGLVGFAAGLITVRAGAMPLAGLVLIGAMSGLSAGPIMSLPAAILRPDTRAAGMGLFYTMYYAVMLAAPWLGGHLAAAAGSAAAAFDAGVAMLVACAVLLALFRLLLAQRRAAPGGPMS